jgi:uncharacterized protein YkwD
MTRSWSLRIGALLAAVGIAAASAPSALSAQRQPSVSLSSLELGVLADINALRTSHHLAALQLSPALTDAARSHSQEMETDGYFAHNSFDGTAFWKRIQRFYPSTSFGFWSVGENLLWSSPGVDAEGALTMWLNSPEHKRNMLDPSWREIGVSAVHEEAAPGVYDGLAVTIVTTDFGVRR